MENTFSIGCLTCKKSLWIGQKGHIYQTHEVRKNLQDFLFNHTYHQLKFGSSETLEKIDSCEDITPEVTERL